MPTLIILNNAKIGFITLSSLNEIIICIQKNTNWKRLVKRILKLFIHYNPRNRYTVNIKLENSDAINFFKRLGFKLIQYTFEFEKNKNHDKKLTDVNISTKLRRVSKSDCRFLYELLKERKQKNNISHKNLPDYEKHVSFVMSKPYSRWYVIEYENRKVGSIYLTHLNEIGIFVQEKMQGQHIGRDAIRLIIKKNARKKYLANISPENNRSIHFFKKNGFNKLLHYTYELV